MRSSRRGWAPSARALVAATPACLAGTTPPHPAARPLGQGSTLCYGITGLDMGFDNPVFAAIELDYAEADQVRRAAVLRSAADLNLGVYLCTARGVQVHHRADACLLNSPVTQRVVLT